MNTNRFFQGRERQFYGAPLEPSNIDTGTVLGLIGIGMGIYFVFSRISKGVRGIRNTVEQHQRAQSVRNLSDSELNNLGLNPQNARNQPDETLELYVKK